MSHFYIILGIRDLLGRTSSGGSSGWVFAMFAAFAELLFFFAVCRGTPACSLQLAVAEKDHRADFPK
jgi:hypothetical protein